MNTDTSTDSGLDNAALLSLLEWQLEAGVTDVIEDNPINRYEPLDTQPPAPERFVPEAVSPVAPQPEIKIDPVEQAALAANSADTLEQLAAALRDFAHCDLRHGAQNFVFSDGHPAARVMLIGEAPGRDEDIAGTPFVGRAGRLLDRMLAAIDLDRRAHDPQNAVYITNVLPWRPPGNRTPNAQEIAMMTPFLLAHIRLKKPDVIVITGNTPCQALLEQGGITRLRGQWQSVADTPVLPTFHPAYLLRNPAAKRDTWADLLDLKFRLKKDKS